MRSGPKLLAAALVLAMGCAHEAAAPKIATVAPPPQQRRVKLAVLPVESDVFPKVASGLNALFHDVQLKGIDDYFLSKVTLEVVQLSIECVEQSTACYLAVGKSLAAQKLLLGHIVAGATATKGKKKDRVPAVKVSVTLFDVDSGAPHEVEKSFKTELDAANGIGDLMREALGEGPTTAGAQADAKAAK